MTLLLILLVAAPLARFIPLATLAAVLFVVAYNMGEWKEIGTILKLSAADKAVWAVTFFLTVFADLTVAVEVGIGLAALLYIIALRRRQLSQLSRTNISLAAVRTSYKIKRSLRSYRSSAFTVRSCSVRLTSWLKRLQISPFTRL
jgi:MFS superfamily sulfate permease-like transporter